MRAMSLVRRVRAEMMRAGTRKARGAAHRSANRQMKKLAKAKVWSPKIKPAMVAFVAFWWSFITSKPSFSLARMMAGRQMKRKQRPQVRCSSS